MCSEKTLLAADGYGDNCATIIVSEAFQVVMRCQAYLPSDGDVWFDCGDDVWACCASLSTLRDDSLNEGFFLDYFDLLARCFEKLPSWCRVRLEDENMLK